MNDKMKSVINKIVKTSLFKPVICIIVLVLISLIPIITTAMTDRYDAETEQYISENLDNTEDEESESVFIRFLKGIKVDISHIVVFVLLTVVLGVIEYKRNHIGSVKEKDE